MNIWKLGCNWGTGQAYFDDFLRTEKIVLGWEAHDYKIGDIVLIAKGYTIVALAKVVGIKTQITENKEYEKQCEKYSIDYLDEVYYAQVEWFDLKENEYFQYELRQGIRQVRSTEIQNKAISLFEKHNFANKLKNNQLFLLNEIANWQLKREEKKVELPNLQRGFVWKAKQIEDLWDSLFRGFPIGSFLLSNDENDRFFLMDGQQRATAIALGYYNPWEDIRIEMWSLKNVPVLWMDISPIEITSSHKYVFRIVTQSHPWGYQRKDNSKTLSISERNKALDILIKNNSTKDIGYTSYPKTSVFPYDSDLPIPLSFLLNSLVKSDLDYENWKENVINLCKTFVPDNIQTKSATYSDKIGYVKAIESLDFKEIYNAIRKVSKFEVHSNLVNRELLTEEEIGDSENPTLFVRINSSGTVLNGDELIYSIYKASFPDTKELVEQIGLSFISAPAIISMVSRIALSELANGEFVKKLDVKSFQNRIKNDDFRIKLKELIGENGCSPMDSAFNRAIEILSDNDEVHVPAVLVKDLIKKNQETFLLLIYWLFKYPKIEIGRRLVKSILAKFTVISWFGIDIQGFVREEWKNLGEDLWIEKLSKEQLEKYFSVMIPPHLLEAYYGNQLVLKEAKYTINLDKSDSSFVVKETNEILDLYIKIFSGEIDESKKRSIWWEFFRRLFWGRSLIVFAQREYINSQFKDFNQIEDLQDTNVPWDWDHIYPNNWVYYQQGIKSAIRDWNNCIGNFRALSLGINRSENAYLSPKDRLESQESRENGFVKDSDFEWWSKIDDNITDKKNTEKVEIHTRAIVQRTLNIYREWWDKLVIENLIDYQSDEILFTELAIRGVLLDSSDNPIS